MRAILLAAVLLCVASAKLSATEALIFNEAGYDLYILIGFNDRPVIADVRFTPPGATDWVHLPREHLRIEKFDFGKILLMRFKNPKDPALPPSFSLSIKKENAVLSIEGKTIKSTVNWDF